MNSTSSKNLLPSDGNAFLLKAIDLDRADQFLIDLLEKIPWENDMVKIFGKTITTARKVAWYGDPYLAYKYSGTTKQPLAWTKLLKDLKELVEYKTGETFNSCLLNLYHNGSESMGWHRDNESSIRKHSPIACLSLGAERRFHFKHRLSQEKITTTLPHGSLLVMAGEIQTHWMHTLPKMARIKTPRISLTFRQMNKPQTK